MNICDSELRFDKNNHCNDETLHAGVHTIAIYVLEKSRKILGGYREIDSIKAKNILNSEEYKQLGNFFFLKNFIKIFFLEIYAQDCGSALHYLKENFENALNKKFDYHKYSVIIMNIIAFLVPIFGFLFFVLSVFAKVKEHIILSKAILRLIPMDIVFENPILEEHFLEILGFEKKQKFDRKGRRR